jgi:hypothetical protein
LENKFDFITKRLKSLLKTKNLEKVLLKGASLDLSKKSNVTGMPKKKPTKIKKPKQNMQLYFTHIHH